MFLMFGLINVKVIRHISKCSLTREDRNEWSQYESAGVINGISPVLSQFNQFAAIKIKMVGCSNEMKTSHAEKCVHMAMMMSL